MKTVSRFLIAASLMAVLSLSAGAQTDNGGIASSASTPKVSVDLLSAVNPSASAEFGPYLRKIISDLKRNWNPLTTRQKPEQGESDVLLTIMPSGKVSELHLEGGHNVALNKSSWNALLKTTFSPLPHGVDSTPLKVRFHFVVS